MIRTAFLPLCLAALPFASMASEEDFIPWQSVAVKSAELPEVGFVTVEISTKGKTFEKFVIRVFGRSRSLALSELKRLEGYPLSSMTIIHEAGYVQLGGHTVHVRLQRTYADSSQLLTRETIYISLPKNAELRISERRSVDR